jgi:protein tyrosine/serine phosphatase
MSRIFIGVNRILETMKEEKINVLVHCTDGWDRTA